MNSKHRLSTLVSDEAVKNLTEAADFAYYSPYPLNRIITINLKIAEVPMERSHTFLTSFMKHAGDWLRTKSIPSYYVWSLENPGAVLNLHVVIHLPPEHAAQFAHRQRGWLKAAGATIKKKVIKSKWIKPHRWDDPLAYIRDLGRRIQYLLKGAHPATCAALYYRERFPLKHKPQGLILGKRAGVSEAIGPKARASAPVPTFDFRGKAVGRPRRPILLDHVRDWKPSRARR